jgi:hypothetical protein
MNSRSIQIANFIEKCARVAVNANRETPPDGFHQEIDDLWGSRLSAMDRIESERYFRIEVEHLSRGRLCSGAM